MKINYLITLFIIKKINNVVFDDKFSKIEWIEFFEENLEENFLFMTKDIYAINDVIMLKNKEIKLEYLGNFAGDDVINQFQEYLNNSKKIGGR